jgi:putative transposase
LEAGLVGVPWDYRWSSARAYALGEGDPLLAANPWYEALSPEAARRQALWRDFLLGDDPKEEAVRRDDWVIGGAAFRRRMQRCRARPAPRGRGRPSQGRAEAAPAGGAIYPESPNQQRVE